MKKRMYVILTCGLTTMIAVWAITALSPSPTAQERRSTSAPRGDVILMRGDTGGLKFSVTAYEKSTAAPTKKTESCSENLSLLMKDGFVIRDIGHHDQEKDFVIYTLVR